MYNRVYKLYYIKYVSTADIYIIYYIVELFLHMLHKFISILNLER